MLRKKTTGKEMVIVKIQLTAAAAFFLPLIFY
jgi:hypothetical protein